MSTETDGTPAETETAVAGLPWGSSALYVVVATSLVVPLDVPFVSPVLPAIADAFAVSSARAGLVITAFAAPGIVFTLLLGVLADKIGRRRVLVPCLALYGLFGVLIVFAGEFSHVLVLRFLQGCAGGGILATLALTIVGDFFDGPRRNAVMGLTTGVTALGAAVYPTIGGALAEIAWNLPFLLCGLAVLAAAVAFFVLEEPAVDRSDRIAGFAYLRRAATAVPGAPAVALYGASLVSATVVFGGILAGVTFLLAETYGLAPAPIGAILTVPLLFAAIFSIGSGRFGTRIAESRLVAIGYLGYGVGFVGTWFATSPLGVAVALAVVGTGHGLVLPSIPAALSRIAPARFLGGVLSLRTSLLLVGQAVGPLVFTVPALSVGYAVPLLVTGLLTGAAGLLALLVLTRR